MGCSMALWLGCRGRACARDEMVDGGLVHSSVLFEGALLGERRREVVGARATLHLRGPAPDVETLAPSSPHTITCGWRSGNDIVPIEASFSLEYRDRVQASAWNLKLSARSSGDRRCRTSPRLPSARSEVRSGPRSWVRSGRSTGGVARPPRPVTRSRPPQFLGFLRPGSARVIGRRPTDGARRPALWRLS